MSLKVQGNGGIPPACTGQAMKIFLGNYGELAKSLFDNEQISEGHYSSLMYDIGIDIFETEEGLNHESENHFT